MPKVNSARNEEDLQDVINAIHDCWFDLSEVAIDSLKSTLMIRFVKPAPELGRPISQGRVLSTIEFPCLESFLRINEVLRCSINDTERVGLYDFNELKFDRTTNRLAITTGVPISFFIEVRRLDVSVEISDKVVEWKTRRKLFGAPRPGEGC